ncbi:sodium-dependent glucose transporter 1A-like [Varroa destructor]|uniref:Major facilitator superfamily domain-containing protein 4A n=1 Tax=Varroa destructor TaxID=109461 RepID=A0A7M7K290_VARDE|nr:sodium-dependent glucose transporter 1A-like [Varroa destructor]XP_022654515.1 sodium-dependent glucose transporter 1A-like [Varroa destructor]XP_022654516.1 sodium-dependent glucose transporter 1A-like [Varroa destructor]XP_022654517.1 sodium-dependent glucose transporter 1A-like [Varroa destructor]XP_022654518.1 sodium-dependent glucose transporter 1A-like [Varroa destructor]
MGETNHVGSLGGGFNENTNEANKVAENSELRESATENYGREGPAGSDVSEMQVELTPLLSNSIRIFQSINLNMASVSLGLTLAIVGPTLLDVSEILGISVAQMSYVAFSGDFGAFIGSFLATPLFTMFNAQCVIIICMLCCGIFNILIPHGSTPLIVATFAFLNGCFFGVQEIGVYVWLVGIWRDHVSPAIQLLHLMYGIGALVAPLIAEPFLSSEMTMYDAVMTTEDNSTSALVTTGNVIAQTSRVYIPYGIIGCIFLLTSVLMMISFYLDSRDIRPQKKARNSATLYISSKMFEWSLVCLVGFYTLIDVTLEACFSKFISVYAVTEHGFTKSAAAFLTSLCYGGFTAARVLAVPLSYHLSPMHLMIIGQCILLLAATALVFLTHWTPCVLWVGCCLLGAGLSPLYGSCTAWVSNHVTLSHNYMSVILILTCSGALLLPIIVGHYIETNPSLLMYVVLVCGIIMSVNLAIMHLTVTLFHKDHEVTQSGFDKVRRSGL